MMQRSTGLAMVMLLAVSSSGPLTGALAENGAVVAVPEPEDGGSLKPAGCDDDKPDAAAATDLPPSADSNIRIAPNFVDTAFDGEVFVATEEWQVVGKDQPIPPGLHVTIDMVTGVKRAKLMEEQVGIKTESEVAAQAAAAIAEADPTGPKVTLDHASLSKVDDGGGYSDNLTATERLEKFAGKLDDLKAKGLQFSEDADVMRRIVQSIAGTDAEAYPDYVFDLLEELEAFVHQVDNALDLYGMGGLEIVIGLLDSARVPSAVPRAAAALVVGAAAQNNPELQGHALRLGVMPKLLGLLRGSPEPKERKKVVYALSALTRHNAEGLTRMTTGGGVELLAAVLAPTGIDLSATKTKVAVLFADLLTEQASALHRADTGVEETDHSIEGMQFDPVVWARYASRASITGRLVAAGWCGHVAGLLSGTGQRAQEHAMMTMLALAEAATSCRAAFVEPAVIGWVAELVQQFGEGLAEDPTDKYAKKLLDLSKALQQL